MLEANMLWLWIAVVMACSYAVSIIMWMESQSLFLRSLTLALLVLLLILATLLISGMKIGKAHTMEHRINLSHSRGGKPFYDHNGNRYNTVGEASKQLGINSGSIWEALAGHRKQAGGYRFTYEKT